MRVLIAALALAAVAVAGRPSADLHASTGPIPLDCDRACLEGVANGFLEALARRDPSGLPLSKDLMYTENNQRLEIGDGFWKTVEGAGNYRHYFADPEVGQVALMGTMREAGGLLLYSLRLRIELGRITEAESVFFRPGGGGPNNINAMDTYVPEDIWFRSIPPAQRPSRQEMISIADGYFTGLQRNDGKGIQGTGTYPFTEDCHRLENGAPTTNVPRPANTPPDAPLNPFWLDCLGQFKAGLYYVVQNIHSRRYPLVDAERGVVWAHSVFDQGTVNEGVLSDGTPHRYQGFNRPSSILVTEAFLIEERKIRRVEMVGGSAPYHMNSPWPGGLSGD